MSLTLYLYPTLYPRPVPGPEFNQLMWRCVEDDEMRSLRRSLFPCPALELWGIGVNNAPVTKHTV